MLAHGVYAHGVYISTSILNKAVVIEEWECGFQKPVGPKGLLGELFPTPLFI